MTVIKNLAFVLLISGAWAAVLNVPEEFESIQSAINAAFDSDTVRVAPGHYTENISFSGRNILVTSDFAFNADSTALLTTVIDGDASASTVTFDQGENSHAVLQGFTIINGQGDEVLFEFTGGGITCKNNSSPTLQNLIIRDNNALGGGGIYIQDSAPIIQYCQITGNYSESTAGGIYCWNGSPQIHHTEISDNYAGWLAGGLFGASNSILDVSNLTVIGNISADLSGGGIYTYNSSAYIENCIVRNNVPDQVAAWHDTGTFDLSIDYCNIENGPDGVVPWQNVDYSWGDHNQQEDPLFVNPDTGNFRLQESSPCVDAGNPLTPLDPDGSQADIGAYYFPHESAPLPGDVNGDGTVNVLDIVRLVNIILGDPPTSQEFTAGDMNEDGVLNVLDVVLIVNAVIG